MTDLLFYSAVAFLFAHEMDGVAKHEWQLLFGLRRLPADDARRWFIALHLPLFVALLALVGATTSTTIRVLAAGVDGFIVVHALLHERLGKRGHRAFATPFSRLLIWAAAALAVTHLAVLAAGGGSGS